MTGSYETIHFFDGMRNGDVQRLFLLSSATHINETNGESLHGSKT